MYHFRFALFLCLIQSEEKAEDDKALNKMLLRLYENDTVRVHSDKQKEKKTITDDRILIIVRPLHYKIKDLAIIH